MEEKQVIEIEVFSEVHKLSRVDFIKFHQIVTKSHFNDIRIPFQSFDQSKVRVLNIFLFYIISIQRNFKVFKEDEYGDKYRSLCTREVSDYYIKNKFLIEEYEFAFLASKALLMKLEECAHILYYLIYGRFASHHYINSICGKKDYDFKKKVLKKGKQVVQNLRLLKKRTLNLDKSQNDIQLQGFKRQLKSALKSEDTHIIWKKQTRNANQNRVKENEKGQSLHATQRNTSSRGYNYNTFIPERITQGQNSSIFETLPFQRKSYQTCNHLNKKGLMRKQKFNEFFDVNDYKLKTKLKKSPSSYLQESKQNFSRNMFFINGDDADQTGKINYENFKNISNSLKLKNSTLDKIRSECSVRNHKYNFQKPNFQSHQQNFTKFISSSKQNSSQSKNVKLSLEQLNEIRKSSNQQSLNLKRNFSLIDGSCHKDLTLAKHLSYVPERNFQFVMAEEQIQNQGDCTINLLRNEDSGKEKQSDEGKKLDYFSKTSVGFKKINCKHKLQKYKSDYRKFMKTQLLDRIRQAS